MEQKTDTAGNVLAWIALILGCLCLLSVIFTAVIVLPNLSVSEWDPLAVPVMLGTMFILTCGPVLMLLTLILSRIARSRAIRSFHASARRCRIFSNIGLIGGACMLLLILLTCISVHV